MRVAARAIDRLVLPPLRDKLLAAAPSIGLLGPGTTLEEASVTLRGDALWFRVALAGEHRIAVSGALEVRVAGPRQLGVRLASLGPVEFTGTLRTRATLGAAGLGALVTGPLAPLGALAGYALADGYIDRRARQEVETQLTAALAVASAIPLIPERAELIVGEPRSRATLAFCAVAIESGGIAAHLSVRPDKPDPKTSQEASRVRTRLAAIPGRRGTDRAAAAAAGGADCRRGGRAEPRHRRRAARRVDGQRAARRFDGAGAVGRAGRRGARRVDDARPGGDRGPAAAVAVPGDR
ncbi:hypothetical protein [Nannocystis pusilla]|uniref:hypothetical protein n=1 Tax=Nannocystis pusilla TaxID=889268 RepID=UPI003B78A538